MQRALAKLKAKKEPIIPDMLRWLVDTLPSKPSLTEVRLEAISLNHEIA